MQIKKGSYRIAIIIGSLVFKIPNPIFLKFAIRDRKISDLKRFRAGIIMNYREWFVWKKTKADFLAKTYFSLGIINIQKFERGFYPQKAEIKAIISRLFIKTNEDSGYLDPHCFNSKNFVKTGGYYKLVDYGDDLNSCDFTIDMFILRWHKVLREELKIK